MNDEAFNNNSNSNNNNNISSNSSGSSNSNNVPLSQKKVICGPYAILYKFNENTKAKSLIVLAVQRVDGKYIFSTEGSEKGNSPLFAINCPAVALPLLFSTFKNILLSAGVISEVKRISEDEYDNVVVKTEKPIEGFTIGNTGEINRAVNLLGTNSTGRNFFKVLADEIGENCLIIEMPQQQKLLPQILQIQPLSQQQYETHTCEDKKRRSIAKRTMLFVKLSRRVRRIMWM